MAMEALALILGAGAPAEASSGAVLEDCVALIAQGGARAEYQCVDRNNRRKEEQMDRLYSEALARVRKREANAAPDMRRDPAHLQKSQAAWKRYVDENCTVVAGLMGGAGGWVSRMWSDCYSQELDNRIMFLGQVAAGEFEGQ